MLGSLAYRRGGLEGGALATPRAGTTRPRRPRASVADGQRCLRPAAGGRGDRTLKSSSRDRGDEPAVRATCSVERAVLEAMRGDFALARTLLAEGMRTIEEFGPHALGGRERAGGVPRRRARRQAGGGGRHAAARASRRSTRAASAATCSTIAGLLAHALLAEGRGRRGVCVSAARARMPPRPTTCSRRCSGAGHGRSSARGTACSSEAEAAAREAVRLSEPTDLLGTPRCRPCRPRGGPRAGRLRKDEARRRSARPRELYESKGNLDSLARVKRATRAARTGGVGTQDTRSVDREGRRT